MNSPCEIIVEQMGRLYKCASVNGYVRIRTPYFYPDGDIVDLYFRESGSNILLTDLGSTLQWLNTQTPIEKRTKRQQLMIQDVCTTHNIQFSDGALSLSLDQHVDLAQAVARLAQAASRVADISFAFRPRPITTVEDEVAEFLSERMIPFRSHEKVTGYSGKQYSIDFYTYPSKQRSYVTLLSTGSRATALEMAEKALGIWRDLDILKQPDLAAAAEIKFVTLFDDTQGVWQAEHEKMLQRDSEVAHWSDAAGFLRKLAA
jgi:hypothetical protein